MSLFRTLTGWNFARRLVLPTPGEELTVEFHAPIGSDERRIFHTRLNSVGLRRLLADRVYSSGDVEDARSPGVKNEPAVVSFMRDGAMYRFETVVEAIYAPGTRERLFSLRRPKRVEKIQRRDAYRVTVETRTTYRLLGTTDRSSDLHGQIVNLSEGGVLLASAAQIFTGQSLLIRVPSGRDGVPMEVMASCIESRAASQPRGGTYFARLRFDDHDGMHLSETQREALARYLFEQQRLMLQTRRLLNASSKR